MSMFTQFILLTVGLLALSVCPESLTAADWKFQLTATPQVRKEPFSGRVYIFFTASQADPREGPDWFHPEPFVALDVIDWNPQSPLVISPATPHLLSFPAPLADLQLDNHRAQAVIRLNLHEREVGIGPGNGFSTQIAQLGGAPVATASSGPTSLVIDQIVPEPRFPTTDRCRELVVDSPLLTAFHNHPIRWKAAVQLPASYATSTDKRYPVIVNIPGFGGSHYSVAGRPPVNDQNEHNIEFIRVTMDPSCGKGHHVFADSENNGPVGQAFISEFIPQLDREYRTVAAPTARFLTGHSSGGWSTLWLQTRYPEHFGGTWSTSPDSVDFSDFQRVNLYAPSANLFRDELGRRRPLGHEGETVLIWTDRFCDMEHVLGYGGQMQSFESVFSPRGEDGTPRRLWDRRTGAIDHEVAETWKRYDIRLRLLSDWPAIGPQLKGKIHVFMGDQDTFYLEGATRNLKATLESLKSDAVVELLPGKDHFNLFADGLANRIRNEMIAAYLQHHPSPVRQGN